MLSSVPKYKAVSTKENVLEELHPDVSYRAAGAGPDCNVKEPTVSKGVLT